MKINLRLLQTLFAALLFELLPSYGQTTLSAGDIAFIASNADGDDEFSFVLLTDISASTSFYITDRGWDDGTGFFSIGGDGVWQWTTSSNLNAGTVIHIKTTDNGVISTGSLAASIGTITIVADNPTYSYAGDQVFIYQGTHTNPTFITGLHYNVVGATNATNWDGSIVSGYENSSSALPDQLTNGVNAIWLYASGPTEKDNFIYNCSVTSGDKSTLSSAINNISNWNVDASNGAAYTQYPFPCSFSVASSCTEPTIPTITASPNPICSGSNSTLTISGTLNDATAWHVYAGSCGGTEIGTTATSSFTVSPSATTTYYVRAEGGCTTPGSCGTATVSTKAATSITQQPASSTTACSGDPDINVSIAATGSGTLSYQWHNSGGAISGANSSSLAIWCSPSNSNTYYCIVTSACGSATSTDATIIVNQNYNLTETVAVCAGNSYTFPDGTTLTNITAQTAHTSNLKTTGGCDSIIETTVQVNPTYNLKETVAACSGSNYKFPDGTTTNITGKTVHTSNLKTTDGCDSIIETTVQVNPTYNLKETVAVCSGNNYKFPDGTTTNITGETVHTSNLKTSSGCDSIIETTVLANPTYNLKETATVCPGDSYTFPDGTTQSNITQQTVHTSSLTSKNSCDSIIETTVTISPVYKLDRTDFVCYGGTYTFPDGTAQENITEQAVHASHLLTVNGSCDSTITTTVNVYPVYDLLETVAVCSGSNYTFPDGTTQKNITEQQVHTSHLLTVNGSCDSSITTTVTVNPVYHLQETVAVCSGSNYTFPDGTTQKNITEKTTHTSSFLTTGDACDSSITTTVNVNPVYDLQETIAVCPGNSYTFPDGATQENITEQVVYTSHLLTANGLCDSSITTTVNVKPIYDLQETVAVCSGSSYTFPDGTSQENITEQVVYTSHLLTVNGSCDSTITTTVNVKPTFDQTETATICEGDSYTFADATTQNNITQSMEYTSYLQTVNGSCDSTITTYVVVVPNYDISESKQVCNGASYTFPDGTIESNITTPTMHVSLFKTVHGSCDSSITTTVTPIENFSTTETIRVCPGSNHVFPDGTPLDNIQKSTSHTSLLSSVNGGCDSTVVTNIEVAPVYALDDNVLLCSGSNYTFPDGTVANNITEQTVHTSILVSVDNCDSTITTTVNVKPTYDETDNKTVEYGESYQFGTQLLTQSGTYTEVFQSALDCDSTVTLLFTVKPRIVRTTVYDTICSEPLSKFRTPREIAESETFHKPGVDSIVKTLTMVYPAYEIVTDSTILFGSTIDFEGKTYELEGAYSEQYQTTKGCDSIRTLNLSVVHKRVVTTLYDTVCGPQSENPEPAFTTTTTDSVRTSAGTDSITITNTTTCPSYSIADKATITFGDTVVFGTQKLTSSGIYTEPFATVHGCDSSVTLHLTVVNKMVQASRYDTICQRAQPGDYATKYLVDIDTVKADGEGIDSVITTYTTAYPSYEVHRNDTIINGDSYAFGNQLLTVAGQYTESFTTVNGCDSIATLTLHVLPKTVEIEIYDTLCGQTHTTKTESVTTESIDTVHAPGLIDSIIHTYTTVHPAYSMHIEESIAYGTAYSFNGQQLTKAGEYTQNLATEHGCDSTVTLSLAVEPSDVLVTVYDTTCGEVYTDKAPIEHATHYDTLATSIGTDSIIKTITTMYPAYDITQKETIPHGDTIIFKGQKLSASGTYATILQTVHGCDSTVVLVLNVLPDKIANIGDSIYVTIKENPKKGTVLVTLPTVNKTGDTIVYSLSDTVNFAIVNGTIRVLNPEQFDTETNPQLQVVVTIISGNETGTAVVTVNNSNVSEKPKLAIGTLEIQENSPALSYIGELPAVDHEGDSVTYTLKATRLVTLVDRKLYIADSAAFDAEKKAVTVNVVVNDGKFSAIVPVTITALNVNDNAPKIVSYSFTFMIMEHSANNTEIGTIAATDADGDALTFSLSDNANGALAIDPATGIVYVADSMKLDYETQPMIATSVVVSDGLFTIEKNITIMLFDGADPDPLGTKVPEANILVYPTNADSDITIEIPQAEARIAILSANGTVADRRSIYGTATISIATLPAGHYTVKVQIGTKTAVFPVIKK